MSAVFRASNLSFRYGVQAPAVRSVTLDIEAQAFCAIIGPNGSGKSSLLQLLLGVLQPAAGSAHYRNQSSTDWDRRALAREVGVVPQMEELFFPFTVRELVAMGRYPYLGVWQSERAQDRTAIEQAMARCDVLGLGERMVSQLSGGERQRVRVARALAQQPNTMVLDEPTAALDIAHEMALFELLADLRAHDGVTVVAATHNLNMAARFATQVVLLSEGMLVATGAPAQVLTPETIEAVYRWPVQVQPLAMPGLDHGVPQIVPLRKDGHKAHSTPTSTGTR